MFPFHNKLDIIEAKTAQIGMVSISSHFNQDVSLYIGKKTKPKKPWLSETPASLVNISGHLVLEIALGLTTPRS